MSAGSEQRHLALVDSCLPAPLAGTDLDDELRAWLDAAVTLFSRNLAGPDHGAGLLSELRSRAASWLHWPGCLRPGLGALLVIGMGGVRGSSRVHSAFAAGLAAALGGALLAAGTLR